MKRKLSEIADISQGSILTRIEDKSSNEIYETITMAELSYYALQSDIEPQQKFVSLKSKNSDKCIFTQEGDIILGLTSGKAMVVDESRVSKLVLSNFALIRIKDRNLVDPYYLCMLFNESSMMSKQLASLFQSTSRVFIILLSDLKDVEIELPDIKKQQSQGKIYDLTRRLTRISRTKTDLKYKLITNQITNLN